MTKDEPSPSELILIGAGEVSRTAWHLADLASAFQRTGNTVVAKELDDTAEHLKQLAKMVENGASRLLNEHLSDSVQQSTNVVLAALAGMEVARRHD